MTGFESKCYRPDGRTVVIGRAPFDTQLSLIDVRWLPGHAIMEGAQGVSTNGADASADDCVEAAAPGAVGNTEQYRANSKCFQQMKGPHFWSFAEIA